MVTVWTVQHSITSRQEIILFLKSSDQLWGPPGLLFYGYQGPFCQGQSIQAMNMTIHFHPVPRLRMSGAVHPLPLHAFMISRWTTSFNLLCILTISWWTACFQPNIFGKVNVQKIHETHFQGTILHVRLRLGK